MDRTLQELLDRSSEKKELRPADIPPLDLYIDQIISLMCSHLEPKGDREPLTRTMIHNYSKAGLIAPVRGKKYSREHILQMVAIYYLKQGLSIEQIRRVLTGISRAGGGENELAQCIDTFLDRREGIHRQLTESIERMLTKESIAVDTPEQALSFLLTLTDLTDTLHRFAAEITQAYFTDPPQKPQKKK